MNKTFVIGIAGGTGSGKTTVANKIVDVLKKKTSIIPQDAFYKEMYNIPVEKRNYDHPDAFDHELFMKKIKEFKEGSDIYIPIYDFSTHSRLKQQRLIKWAPILIVEGILIFTLKKLRDLMDFKIFVDTPSDIRLTRRILRDINERGRNIESVINQYINTVRPMHIEFVEPTKKYADIIVPEGGYNEKAIEFMTNYLKSVLMKNKKY